MSTVSAWFAYRTHISVNGRMAQFLKMAEARFKALGKLEEQTEAAARKATNESEGKAHE